jgi:hypothetical protein
MPIADSLKPGANVMIHHRDLTNLHSCVVGPCVPAHIMEAEGATP